MEGNRKPRKKKKKFLVLVKDAKDGSLSGSRLSKNSKKT